MARRRPGAREDTQFETRSLVVLGLVFVGAVLLCLRALDLQVLNNTFLNEQADARQLRTVEVAAHRGAIVDRRGENLAVSTPVDSVWANPKELLPAADRFNELAGALDVDSSWLRQRVSSNSQREFVYLRRHLRPDVAADVEALQIPGVYLQREYRRYYPHGEVTGHVVGFTDVDDEGQEGLELAYDHWLRGEPGLKRVLKDRRGRSIENVEEIRAVKPGRTLHTSIDLSIQYRAYRELLAAVQSNKAQSGSAVVLDVRSGEVLAMVNQPAYNPNDRSQLNAERYRNRAATDIFEPGSSFKPLIISAALESGLYTPDSVVDTNPGYFRVPSLTVEDTHNLGVISLTTILKVSSNVGASKVALSLQPRYLWSVLSRFGIGRVTESGFPGESAGLLNNYEHWRETGQATIGYGYGLSVTALQLAEAYATLGAGGIRRPVSFTTVTHAVGGERVVSPETARAVVHMLESVVAPGGTGTKAAVPGYRVAGKTGTAWKSERGGYSEDKYVAIFAGLAPASHPRLAVVVVVDEPSAGVYYGGEVAAPAFSRIMESALRTLGVPPDAPRNGIETVIASAGEAQ